MGQTLHSVLYSLMITVVYFGPQAAKNRNAVSAHPESFFGYSYIRHQWAMPPFNFFM